MPDARAERRQNLKAVLIVGGVLVALGGLGVVVWMKPHWFFSTTGKEYGSSLAEAVPGATGAGGCGEQEDEGWWWCGVETDAGSGYGEYYVLRTRGERCWTAHRVSMRRAENEPPKQDVVTITQRTPEISDCVGAWDYIAPSNPYGFNADRTDPPRPFALRTEP